MHVHCECGKKTRPHVTCSAAASAQTQRLLLLTRIICLLVPVLFSLLQELQHISNGFLPTQEDDKVNGVRQFALSRQNVITYECTLYRQRRASEVPFLG